MYKFKKLLVVLKRDWLDYILLLFLSLALILIAHSLSIIVWELSDSDKSETNSSELSMVQGRNFHNGIPESDKVE